jgi:CRP/FNR family cyclic AMP-dependent transcriptional regulator
MTAFDPTAVPMLAVLKERDRARLLAESRQRTYAPGDIVVREGDSALNLFVILQGTARIDREGVGTLGRLGTGDFFGEIGLVEEHARLATVVAEDSLTCLLLPAWEFKNLLKEHPEMAVPMLYTLIHRAHDRDQHRH